MPPSKLWLLSTLLGLAMALPHVYGLLKPGAFGELLRRFPRSEPAGLVLMLTGTVWFLWNVQADPISDFAAFKPALLAGFGIVGVGSCFFVKDFLAVRGLAVVTLLFAKVLLDEARWVDSEWRLVLAVWCYVWIVASLWFTISPWRLRDILQFVTATESRTRVLSAANVGFGLLLTVLGLAVFRPLAG